jgi:aspartate aminotransferase
MMEITSKNMPESSATVVINSIAQQKIAAGIRVFNLSAGEPKLPTPAVLTNAVGKAIAAGKTTYPPVGGVDELRALASAWMNNTYDCQFTAPECLIVNGGKFGIYLLLQMLLKPGDEVIITAPYWVSYPPMIKLFGGQPVIINTEETAGWKMTAQQLDRAYSTKSKILILNNGANPTGMLYSKKELKTLLAVAKKYNLLVISDEVYSGLVYDNKSYISCGAFSEYGDNVIIIQSCSKNFSMTGWRVGFVFAPTDIIKKLTVLIGQSTSGVTTISQWAAVAALKHANKITISVQKKMQKRRDLIIKSLRQHLGIIVNPPASALYLFIALADLGVANPDSELFCKQALEIANVALVPGKAFGKEGYIRFSFGAVEEDLKEGVKALAQFLVR